MQQGDYDAALACYEKVADLGPDPSTRWQNLGNLLLQTKDWAGAVASYQQALKVNPGSAALCDRLGVACYQNGQARPAAEAWRRSLTLDPQQAEVQNNLAWLLATTPDDSLRNNAQALLLAGQARLSGGDGNPVLLRTLAAAYAGSARYAEALTTAGRALQLALLQTNAPLAGLLTNDLAQYQSFTPLREAMPGH